MSLLTDPTTPKRRWDPPNHSLASPVPSITTALTVDPLVIRAWTAVGVIAAVDVDTWAYVS